MRLTIIRHGDPNYELDTITPAGEKEAAALVPRLMQAEFTHAYASPMGRAQATAQPFIKESGLALTTLDWCAEWWVYCPDERHGLWDVDPETLLSHSDPKQLCENPSEVDRYVKIMQEGSDALLAAHGLRRQDDGRYQIERANEEHIVVFCHNGFGLAWLSYLLNQSMYQFWSQFWLAPTSVTTLIFETRDQQTASARVYCMSDCSHLHAAGLPILPRGLKANIR